MKKMILLIVSGLLIACMAGSAMANPAGSDLRYHNGGSVTDLNLKPGDSITVDYVISGLAANTESDVWTFATPIVTLPFPVPAITGAVPSDIQVTFPKGTSFTPTTACTINGLEYTLENGITITNVAGKEGQTYKLQIDTNSAITGQHASDSATVYENVKSIPEFPTVALPVAGVLGLLFVFGRKKEGL